MESQKVSYYNEISLMMFGFGDSHKPNPDTVRLVESVVLKQLRTIIQEAFKYWNGQSLRGEELVFLMRKNKWKMRRFLKYAHHRNFDVYGGDEVKVKKNLVNLITFIKNIDETGELTDLTELDEVKREREIRLNRISLALDEKKYLEFQRARCTSFNTGRTAPKGYNTEKFRTWLDPSKEINFSECAKQVLLYYAYQTVAEIVDYAFLVRMDSKRTSDPLSNLTGAYYTAAMFTGEHRFSGPNPDYTGVYNGQPPISVSEIREVLRRYNMPQAGVLNFGKKLPDTHYIFAL